MKQEGQFPLNSSATPNVEETVRLFNSALIRTAADPTQDFSSDLLRIVETPAFRSLLSAVRTLAQSERIAESEAAEQLVRTFRDLDKVWRSYVYREGLDRLTTAR